MEAKVFFIGYGRLPVLWIETVITVVYVREHVITDRYGNWMGYGSLVTVSAHFMTATSKLLAQKALKNGCTVMLTT